MDNFIEIEVKDFNLDHIFDCGQCFRWEKREDGSYSGIAFGKPVNMAMQASDTDEYSGILRIINADEKDMEEIWKRYLDLDRDYGKIKKTLTEKDPVMGDAIKSGQGIRILRQEPWETIVSFIISQNNNIPRIKKCIEGLCCLFGEKAGELQGKEYYSFPSAKSLAEITEEDLAPIRLGYRARYIVETARTVALDEDALVKAATGTYRQAYEYLTGLCGVGPKVANCIALFGLGKMESFPIDVWMRRVMHKLYGMDENDMKAMKEFAEQNYGQYGGIAQQYLFYHIRQLEKTV